VTKSVYKYLHLRVAAVVVVVTTHDIQTITAHGLGHTVTICAPSHD